MIDYHQFCESDQNTSNEKLVVKEVDVHELSQMIIDKVDYQLIDVREPYEYEIANLNGELMPLKQVSEFVPKIEKNKRVVIHCRSGVRSAKAIKQLENEFGFDNLYNLKGGILAYADEIDPEIAKY